MANDLAVWGAQLRQEFQARRDRLVAVAPRWLRGEEEMRAFEESLMLACWEAPGLLAPELRTTLWRAVRNAVRLGLEIGGPLGQAYLIPYKHDVVLVPGYKGLKELAYRSRRVRLIDADVVYADDQFEVELGAHVRLRHVPNLDPDASTEVKAVWALARLQGAETVVRVMSRAQIDAHRARNSRGKRKYDDPWETHYGAMAMKTALLRLYKLLPLPTRLQSFVQGGEYAEGGVSRDKLRSGDTAPAKDMDAIAARLDSEPEVEAERQPLDAASSKPEEIPF